MDLYLRELLTYCPYKVRGVLHPDIGVQAALHQDPSPPKVHRLLYLLQDLLDGQHVAVTVLSLPFGAVEGAEGAGDPADVCVVDVPVHNVRNDVVRMEPTPYSIRLRRKLQEVLLEEPGELLFGLAILQPSIQYALLQRCHALTLS